ncbi:phosphatase PAP2 family protein [Rickettsia asembonensis]|uniref:hypothetical protein n=1 Tax=Rickettsia asembonensis TaxID=1068590 RepID=UPI000A525840|nr:hypothetical protein [Rickettsia asembonensis]
MLFGQEYCYEIIIILGFTIFRKQLFAQAICVLLLFTTILNILLKYTFEIPLNPALNIKGFAFPSGHMSSGVVFYGWFFANIRYSLLRIIIVVILTDMGFSLIYKGYHYPVIIQKYPYMFGAFLWLLTVPMIAYLKIIELNCLGWVWTVFWGLLGFTISWGCFINILTFLNQN